MAIWINCIHIPNFQYGDAKVLLRMVLKTPGSVTNLGRIKHLGPIKT